LSKAQFEALLPLIITALVHKIIERKQMSQDEAILYLYNSELYSVLDDEKTKVWHYSAEKLFLLLDEEKTTGKFDLPE
jgi:hypothetical protein